MDEKGDTGSGKAAAGLRVLVVDDVAANRRLLAALLQRLGHRTAEAQDGEAALRMLQTEAFDVVLMDLEMPRLDGLATTRAIRALPRPLGEIPVLAVTAHLPEDSRPATLAAGMNGEVGKPLTLRGLEAALLACQGRPPSQALPLVDRARLDLLRQSLDPARLGEAIDEARQAAQAMQVALAPDASLAERNAALRRLIEAFEPFGATRLLAVAEALAASAPAPALLAEARRVLDETQGAILPAMPRRPPAGPGRSG